MGWEGAHRNTCTTARGSSGVWAECRRCCHLDNQENGLPEDCNVLLQFFPSRLGPLSRRTELLLSPIPECYSWSPESTDLRIPRLAMFACGCFDPEKNSGIQGPLIPAFGPPAGFCHVAEPPPVSCWAQVFAHLYVHQPTRCCVVPA